jgi:hypothetical protein
MKHYCDVAGAMILTGEININRVAELAHAKPEYVKKVLDDLRVKINKHGFEYFERFDELEPNHRDGSIIFREHGISESKEFTGGDRQVMAYLAGLAIQKGV